MTQWHYYNHAAIPDCLPHETPDLSSIEDRSIWKNKKTILARWTSDFDRAEPTSWWYVIKDSPFDISSVKAKRRYEINKGCKFFNVQQLASPVDYSEKLFNVQVSAFSAYPPKYRPTVIHDVFISSVSSWCDSDIFVYGAFSKSDHQLCGYALLKKEKNVLHFNVLKTRPDCEKKAINAAIIYKILQDFDCCFGNGFYICDGSRSIVHETAFQDYLEKYFGFRKAYCTLHVTYNPSLKPFILFLYKLKGLFRKLDFIGLIHKINGIFIMQEIVDQQENQAIKCDFATGSTK